MENEIEPQNQEDVNPTTQQDKIQEILEGKLDAPIPETTGTGGNNPINGIESVRINEDDKKETAS